MPVTERVEYIVGLRDNMTRKLKGITKATNVADKAMMGLGKRFLGFAAVAGAARGLGQMVGKMADFEQVASNLSAITGATGEDLDFLKRKAIELGGATTKSATEALEGFKLIASAKPELLSNAAALAATTKEAIALSEASGLGIPDAAKALTSALNQFDLAADQSSRVINVLAAGSKFAAAEIPDLAASLDEFGGVAASLNITLEESAAAVETLSAKNLKGARAGIQMRNVLLKLGGSTDRNINPAIVGLGTALENLAPIQDDVTALTKMFGRQNVLAAQTLIKSRDRYEDLTVAMTGTNIAYEQARVNTDNLRSDVLEMNSAWEQFVLNLNEGGGKITEVFRKATRAATQFANGLNMMAKGEEKILGEKVNVQMEAFVARLRERGITDVEELRQAIFEEGKRVDDVLTFYQDKVNELGGAKKVQKKRGVFAYSLADVAGLIGLDKPMGKLVARDVTKEQLKVLGDYQKALDKFRKMEGLDELFGILAPQEAPPPPDGGGAGITPTKAAKKQIATITGAAPKTFNINIENLIENMEISTTNLTESASEVKIAITRAMSEALADVEPITI